MLLAGGVGKILITLGQKMKDWVRKSEFRMKNEFWNKKQSSSMQKLTCGI